MNMTFLDGGITLTLLPEEEREGTDTALLTVRGKDHDLDAATCRKLAASLREAARQLDGDDDAGIEVVRRSNIKSGDVVLIRTNFEGLSPDLRARLLMGRMEMLKSNFPGIRFMIGEKDTVLEHYRHVDDVEKDGKRGFTVIGVYEDNHSSRYAEWVEASSPEEAEQEILKNLAAQDSPSIIVAGVVAGMVEVVS